MTGVQTCALPIWPNALAPRDNASTARNHARRAVDVEETASVCASGARITSERIAHPQITGPAWKQLITVEFAVYRELHEAIHLEVFP